MCRFGPVFGLAFISTDLPRTTSRTTSDILLAPGSKDVAGSISFVPKTNRLTYKAGVWRLTQASEISIAGSDDMIRG